MYKAQAMDCQREKHQFQLQREALCRGVIRHAERLSGVIHGSILEAEHAEIAANATRSMQFKLNNALVLSEIHADELSRAEEKVHELEEMKAALESSQLVIADSWRHSNTQLDEYHHTIHHLNNELVNLESLLSSKEGEAEALKEEQQILMLEKSITQENLDRLLLSLQQAVEACKADHLQSLDLFEQRGSAYRKILLEDVSAAIKLENMKLMVNALLDDILNSNKITKQNLDVTSQIKDGVEQLVAQLTAQQRTYTTTSVSDRSS
jgi:hypothetical protein